MKKIYITSISIFLSTILQAKTGQLDTTFGNGGIVITSNLPLLPSFIEAFDNALQLDGKIVVVGDASNSSNRVFMAGRYLSNGSLDTFFNAAGTKPGIVLTDVTPGFNSGASNVALQSLSGQEKIVSAGFCTGTGGQDIMALVRYNNDGLLDPSFGSSGIVTVETQSYTYDIQGVAILNGKIVVAGTGFFTIEDRANPPFQNDLLVARFDAVTGVLDTTFNPLSLFGPQPGIVITDVGSSTDDHANDVVIQSDNKIVITGSSDNQAVTARYNTDGSLDASFGVGGIAILSRSDIISSIANALVLQSDGKIVITGNIVTTDGPGVFVARYTTSGTLDTSFGTGGVAVTMLDSRTIISNDIALNFCNQIVIVGSVPAIEEAPGDSLVNDNFGFFIAQYNADGILDANFGVDGIVVTAIQAANLDFAEGVVIQPDNKIVAAGLTNSLAGDVEIALARYLDSCCPPVSDQSLLTQALIAKY